ncbi:MAG TPA: CocE/NonD family hydrolase [Candidatus Eisenbacteria bacterium]|nr:CocE/NonD family hydrolase [Candidatus Eisenbacteria bacterium]
MKRSPVVLLFAVALLGSTPQPVRAALRAQAGIGFVAVLDTTPGTEVVLQDRRGLEVGRGTTDAFGSFIFRELAQGEQYTVRAGGSSTTAKVLSFDDTPDPSLYTSQSLGAGLQYIRMRDGTLLSAMVRAPAGMTLADGPFPTVVEYSGYAVADPDDAHMQASSLIASVLGFATVGVNMRGSGCSGGVIDLFDLPTTADGYDVIEAVAAQPWVQGGKVGMIGISFPGISQLFVGGARPPHLAALAPLSTIADIYRAPGFPGGIFNNGFAETWLRERKDDAAPAPAGGQSWAIKRVNDGDQTCLANQRLRLQTQDPVEVTRANSYFTPSLMVNRSPINWVAKIDVPMFYSSAFQDEQTGGDFASMLYRFPKRPDVKITVTNGVHSSTLDPETLWNWNAFLDIYVANRVPDPFVLGLIAPIVYHEILGAGTPTPPLPAVNRFAGITSVDEARQLFEADPYVRVMMENGAGSPIAGLPASTFELGFDKWPPRQVRATTWYFGPNGTLGRTRPRGGDAGVDVYYPDPDVRPAQTIPGQGQSESWEIIPPYDWRPLVDRTAVAYATAPLTDDTTIVGPGSVDLWLQSTDADTDLQVTLSEIRPDGLETYVQNGWLRASHRKLGRSSKLEPRPTHLEKDAKPLPPHEFVKTRVGLFASSHVFRKGSRIRISIEAPGGDRTRWRFDTPATGGHVRNEISRIGARASRLVLPVVPGVEVPQTLPPCPGLRGQPCRTYVPAWNGG